MRLTQVFVNLLNNAAKYTRSGGIVAVRVARLDTCAVVEVLDTGIGIPAHMLTKIFHLFTQYEAALDRSQGGLGIGLSLVKGFVELHGGTVEAHSDGVGKGSRFVVRLPVVRSEASPAG